MSLGPTVTVTPTYATVEIDANGATVTVDVPETTVDITGVGPAGPGVATGGTTGQVLTKASATNYDTTWATPTTPGLVLIKSQAISSGVASVVITGAFSATYRNYLVVIDRAENTSPNNSSLRMTIGSVSTGYYLGGRSWSFTSAQVTHATSNGPYWFIGYTEQEPWGGQQVATVTVSAPFLTTRTSITSVSNGGEYASVVGGTVLDTESQTAFTITISNNTFVGGRIAVYGYTL